MLFIDLFSIFLLILVNGYFSASEIALISLRKSRVRHLVKSGFPPARRVQMLQEEPERFLATVQIGVTLFGTLASALGGVIAIERITPLLRNVPLEIISRAASRTSPTVSRNAVSPNFSCNQAKLREEPARLRLS